jgi:hypothetical protein
MADKNDVTNRSFFWKNIIRAVEAEPRETTSVRGASGIQHPTIAAGVDEARRRLLIISGNLNAYSASLAQSDIQANIPSLQVIMARPIAVNVPGLANTVSGLLGRSSMKLDELTKYGPQLSEYLSALTKYLPNQKEEAFKLFRPIMEIINSFEAAPLNVTSQILEIMQQLGKIRVETIDEISQASSTENPVSTKKLVLHLERLMSTDPTEDDRQLGICAVPLYGFSPSEVEIIQRGADIEAIKDLLRRHNLLQYFFPAPDQLALGLVDRGATKIGHLLDHLTQAPSLGHPFGPSEITPPAIPVTKVIDALQERKLLVEGEIGLEITQEGHSIRTAVRFKPREGLLSKLINRFSFNIDLKDLFRGTGSP